VKNITVLGAGNGAQTTAADLASKGHRVTLFEHPDFAGKIADLNSKGNRITLTNALNADVRLHEATTDIGLAVKGADVVFFVAPTFAQAPIFSLALPHFEEGQTVVIIPGNFGSFALRKMLHDAKAPRIFLAEADTLPYACRLVENGNVNVWGVKKYVRMGTLPGSDFPKVMKALEGVFPVDVHELPNSLAAGLSNANMIVHCATMVMNAGRIESEKGNFRFYTDGMTPSVCRVQEAVDAERLAVAAAFGIKLESTFDGLKKMYGLEGNTLYEILAGSPVYGKHGPDAPKEMGHRYISEDVPYLLVSLSAFGKMAGVPTPATDSVVTLAGLANGTDYSHQGWTKEKLGIEGMTRESLVQAIQ
jgi:opine dehydrogenase